MNEESGTQRGYGRHEQDGGMDRDAAFLDQAANEPSADALSDAELQNAEIVNIAIIRPAGYEHSSALNEVVETLYCGFCRLGYLTKVEENVLIDDGLNIVLGAHLLGEDDLGVIPERSIIYNLEQVSDDSPWMSPTFAKLYEKFDVWDYSVQNINEMLRRQPTASIRHLPLGYDKSMTRIEKAAVQDIDVLFYGSVNERRQKILDDLSNAGLKVESLFGVYGVERDEYIARAKVVVNIHFYSSNVFEQARVSYLLANRKAVVSEHSEDAQLDAGVENALRLVPYEQIVETCLELVNSEQSRLALEENALDYIGSLDMSRLLERVLTPASPQQGTQALSASTGSDKVVLLPTTINIGSGKDFLVDALNVDVLESCHPDAIVDLSDPDLLGKTVQSRRHGEFVLREDQFECIIANDVLEHIPDLVTAMTNCLGLLRVGGQFHISVPYDLSYGAWQDPTHVRAFNERSWLYYTEWYWYLHWTEARFVASNLRYDMSPIGLSMQAKGMDMDEILTRPRSVDNMRVTLTKRLLLDSEKRFGERMMASERPA